MLLLVSQQWLAGTKTKCGCLTEHMKED